jgi:hypothetical protein
MIFNGTLTAFAVALIHLLDRQAVAALDALKPVLDLSKRQFREYAYRLATMPPVGPLIAGLGLAVFAIAMERLWIAPVRYAALDNLPVFSVVYQIIDKASAFLLGALVYHTIRQLRLVDHVNSNHTRINLFRQEPLQAFSRLTATTAVGLLVGVYGWMVINPELLTDPVSLGFVAGMTVLAAAVFILPLRGVHRLMQEEKDRELADLNERFEGVFGEFNRRVEDRDLVAAEALSGTVASLEIQHKMIEAIPTWPWRPETARFALTAIALPLVLMIVGFLIERALGL